MSSTSFQATHVSTCVFCDVEKKNNYMMTTVVVMCDLSSFWNETDLEINMFFWKWTFRMKNDWRNKQKNNSKILKESVSMCTFFCWNQKKTDVATKMLHLRDSSLEFLFGCFWLCVTDCVCVCTLRVLSAFPLFAWAPLTTSLSPPLTSPARLLSRRMTRRPSMKHSMTWTFAKAFSSLSDV